MHDITENTKSFIAENFKNTELGLQRIARNLGLLNLSKDEIVANYRDIILSTPIENIEIRGKNYYLSAPKHNAILTVNRSSVGIITAKTMIS